MASHGHSHSSTGSWLEHLERQAVDFPGREDNLQDQMILQAELLHHGDCICDGHVVADSFFRTSFFRTSFFPAATQVFFDVACELEERREFIESAVQRYLRLRFPVHECNDLLPWVWRSGDDGFNGAVRHSDFDWRSSDEPDLGDDIVLTIRSSPDIKDVPDGDSSGALQALDMQELVIQFDEFIGHCSLSFRIRFELHFCHFQRGHFGSVFYCSLSAKMELKLVKKTRVHAIVS